MEQDTLHQAGHQVGHQAGHQSDPGAGQTAGSPRFIRQPPGARDHPALVLNADYRPLSYLPLSLWPWQEAVKAAFLDRVHVISEYEEVVRSPSMELRIPSVVVLRDYVRPAKTAAFTRFNLFLRDEFTCQYCGAKGEMTFDHVIPRSRGGRTTWQNVVAACGSCNLRKGSKTLRQAGMRLRKPAREPLPASCRTSAASSRPTICMKAGWISSIGMRNWKTEVAQPPSGEVTVVMTAVAASMTRTSRSSIRIERRNLPGATRSRASSAGVSHSLFSAASAISGTKTTSFAAMTCP